MKARLSILQAGPGMSLQDLGRPGHRAFGLTQGGAADRSALYEGAALLGQAPGLAALEMVGVGGTFSAGRDLRIALTGARMSASIDGAPLVWNASHLLPAGAELRIGGARSGVYGYLHVGGGFGGELQLGSRASHLSIGIGKALKAGDSLPLCPDRGGPNAMTLPCEDRFEGGRLRMVASLQTDAFDAATRECFAATAFRRDPRANRTGVRLNHDGEGFFAQGQLSIVSEVIVPGDIQITGEGAPFVLLSECQTTGGYPRIGTVLPCDLPRVAQAPVGAALRFESVSLAEASEIECRYRAWRADLPRRVTPLLRDPAAMRDLLSYQLVGGMISARDDPFEQED
ncbi:biotin-dependent carboxyltransferase family protein [Sulfitobacter aestuarii]|uniref:Biotin-dependent carboxyltransferase family protein n=1 Tax=Sulfitobacter aestuarii TaxID=2161676 RepID=A0ABW5U8I6_9RHOB